MMRTHIRHDLGGHALVGHVSREGDNGGPLVAIWFDDTEAGVKIGLRIHTASQAQALVEAAQAAQAELATAEIEYASAYEVFPGEIERRLEGDRREKQREDELGRRMEDL